ncbi:MAG: adenosine deaminase, partial [Deltaproteobacteria bacterium]|nr:adenosine deaminase [Deltaproteobacteria bacterium]
ENLGDLREFAPLYRLARDHGLRLKAHAGELLGPEAVRGAVEILELDAVQHGIRAVEDPHVADLLAERGTLLHLCPTSNVSLGVVDTMETHPARRLHEHGVRITVNTDDYALFGAEVTDELLNLRRMGFDTEAIADIVDNGLSQIR